MKPTRDMSKKRTVIHLLLFVAVSSYIPTGEGIFTACTATNNGTAGRVWCSFSEDIKESKRDFMIQRYDLDSGGQPVDVLTCIWTRAFGQRCDVSPTYQFDYKVSSEVGLDIPNIAKEHEGMYMCLMIPPDDDHVEVCEMRIVDRGTAGRPKATTTMSAREVPQTVVGNTYHHLYLVIGILSGILATLAAIATVVILLRWIRERQAPRKGTLNDHLRPVLRVV